MERRVCAKALGRKRGRGVPEVQWQGRERLGKFINERMNELAMIFQSVLPK